MGKALKNWTVTAKAVKNGLDGLLNYTRYLNSELDHEGQEIHSVFDGTRALANTVNQFNTDKRLSGVKGGRPSGYGFSVAFSYPFELSNSDFKGVLQAVLREFYRYVIDDNNEQIRILSDKLQAFRLKTDKTDKELRQMKRIERDLSNMCEMQFSEEDLKRWVGQIISVVHRGDAINNHNHVILSKIFSLRDANGRLRRVSIDLSKKKYLHRLKTLNNEVIEKLIGISTADYSIQARESLRKRRSIMGQKRKQLQSEIEEFAELNNEVMKLLEEINSARQSIIESLEEGVINESEAEQALGKLDTATRQAENKNTQRARKSMDRAKRMMP